MPDSTLPETTRTSEGPDPEQQRLSALRRIEYLLGGLLILFFFWSISLAKVVVLPIVMGFLISLTLAPLCRWLSRLGLPTAVSAVLLVFTIGFSSAFGLYMLSGPATDLMERLPLVQERVEDKLGSFRDKIQQVQQAEAQMQNLASGEDDADPGDPEVTTILVDEPSFLESALASLAGTGTALVIALILAMFLLASGDMFQRKLVQSFPRFTDKKRALRVSHDIERQISRYLGAITVINACLGVAVGLSMQALGVPYAHVWGVAAFLLNYLPYLGAMIGVGAVAAVSLVTFDTVGAALVPPAVYLTLTSIEGQMVTPWLVGRHLSLNAASVFIAVIFWAWLWGVAGALMAVPFLVFAKVVCDNLPGLEFVGRFLSAAEEPTAD